MVIMASILAVVSDQVILAILTLIGTTISAGVTVLLALKGTNRKLDEQKEIITELKENTDGKLAELMKATSRADKAESHAEGKAEEKLEAAAAAGAQAGARAEMPKATPSATIPVKIESPKPVPVIVVEKK